MLCRAKNSEKSNSQNYEIKHPELEYALYLNFLIFRSILKTRHKAAKEF